MERIFVFLRSPGSATAVLLGATLIALIVANSPLATQYMSLVNLKLGPLTTMEWVNDALMAIFFLFVGLEVKRELVSGEYECKAYYARYCCIIWCVSTCYYLLSYCRL